MGAHSSAGRVLEWHSRGQEFDPPWVHLKALKKKEKNGVVAQHG